MSSDELQRIAAYVMPSLPACPSDLGFLFGTRHGVSEFCAAAHRLWREGMFSRLLISGGVTGSIPVAEADMIAERLVGLGMPEGALILETAATNTGENVRFGRARVAAVTDLVAIRSVLLIGKMCSTRRYLMTMQRHWPGVRLSVCPVNYFGVPDERWHEQAEFRARVLSEFDKIPRYLAEGFLEEINACPAYPQLAPRQSF
ncbi:MAG: YdcF family protein [Telluria sp.]